MQANTLGLMFERKAKISCNGGRSVTNNLTARQDYMRTSRKTDFCQKKQTSAGLKITFVDMTYPGQRPELPSLSRVIFSWLILTLTKRRGEACKITFVRGLQLLVRVNFRPRITYVHICTITITRSWRMRAMNFNPIEEQLTLAMPQRNVFVCERKIRTAIYCDGSHTVSNHITYIWK